MQLLVQGCACLIDSYATGSGLKTDIKIDRHNKLMIEVELYNSIVWMLLLV